MKYTPVPSTIPALDMRKGTVKAGGKKMKRGKGRGRRKSGRY
jgi:hypothetical protein